MKNKFLMAGLAGLVLGLVPAAQATLITETYSFSDGITPYSSSVNVGVENYTFGTAPGDVDSITFVTSASMTGNATVYNGSTLSQSFKGLSFDAYTTISVPGGTSSSALGDQTGVALLGLADPSQVVASGTVHVNSGSSVNYTPVGTAVGNSFLVNSSTTLDANGAAISGSANALASQFLGSSGTVPVTLESAAGYSLLSGNANLTFTSTDTVSGTLEVEFDVVPGSPVPDRGAWITEAMMFGILVLGTGRSFWRKRSQPSC